MYPILARYGPFLVYSYEVTLALGILACLGLLTWMTRDEPERRGRLFSAILLAALIAVLGGRVIFVLSQWSYYTERPGEIWLVWRGGLSYHGALIAGLVALWLWSWRRRTRFEEFAGPIALALPLLGVFGWIACWLEGCAFGQETTIGLLSADLPDSFGVYAVRYQIQVLGVIFSVAVFTLILDLYKSMRPLILFWLAIGSLAVSRIFLSLLRGDQAPFMAGLRADTAADGVLALLAVSALVILAVSEYRSRSNSIRGAP